MSVMSLGHPREKSVFKQHDEKITLALDFQWHALRMDLFVSSEFQLPIRQVSQSQMVVNSSDLTVKMGRSKAALPDRRPEVINSIDGIKNYPIVGQP